VDRRFVWLDALRVLAALAVIWLHVAANVVTTNPNPASLDWWIGNLADAGVRWSVPVFVMISGGLLLPRARDQSVIAFYRRRIPRIGIPLLFWSAVYSFYAWMRFGSSPTRLLVKFVLGEPFYHLWFLFALAGLYLAAPFIARSMGAMSRPQLWAATIGSYLLFSLHEGLLAVQGKVGHDDAFSLWLPYVPYFVAGSLIIAAPARGRRSFWMVCLAGSVGVIALATGVLVPVLGGPRSWTLMYGYLNPFVATSSVSVVFLGQAARYGAGVAAVISKIAPVTLGIYVLHPFWIDFAAACGLTPLAPELWSPAVGIPVVSLFVTVLSYVSCVVLRALPGGRHLVT
jgi:surface polysaccharide O-acyltransferase-like enzyme